MPRIEPPTEPRKIRAFVRESLDRWAALGAEEEAFAHTLEVLARLDEATAGPPRPPSLDRLNRELAALVAAREITQAEALEQLEAAREAIRQYNDRREDSRSLVAGIVKRLGSELLAAFRSECTIAFPRLQEAHAAALAEFRDAVATLRETETWSDREAVHAGGTALLAWKAANDAAAKRGALLKFATQLRQHGAIPAAGEGTWGAGFDPAEYHWISPPAPDRTRPGIHHVRRLADAIARGAQPALLSADDLIRIVAVEAAQQEEARRADPNRARAQFV